MFQALINVFRIPELRAKILFTLGMLVVYRLGHWIPIPGINQDSLKDFFQLGGGEGAAQRVAQFISVFSGGAFSHSTIFALGVMPYISASIIVQLFTAVHPKLKKLQEEGPTGRQKIMEWTRLLSIGLALFQAYGFLQFASAQSLVYPEQAASPMWWVMALTAMVAGTVFLMWLGEQIDKFGIGNGMSMIIMTGIITNIPSAVLWVVSNFDPGDPAKMGLPGLMFIIAGFVIVVAGSVLMTVAQRRIPIQQAKHTRGRKVVGGQRSFLPLRVNHGGVMPIIFASSLLIFPSVIFSALQQQSMAAGGGGAGVWNWLHDSFIPGAFPYTIVEMVMIFFFAYFWITVQFNPEDMSKQLRDHGSFIPGLRPGPRTAEYLETVMERITFVGAAFLAIIAVTPMVINRSLNVDYAVTQFLGGTGLLIVVSVLLDFIQRVEANLLMRNYAGFLGGNDDGKGARIRGPRG